MIAVGVLVSLIIVAIIIYLYKYKNQEGFSSYYNEKDRYSKESGQNFQNNVNKALYVNSGLQEELNKITDAFASRDIESIQKKKNYNYSKYFVLDPIPGLENDSKQCSMVLEPRLLPKHDSTTKKGCGWWYIDDDGVQSIGALGTETDPFTRDSLEKNMPGGIWLWDLELAQKKEDDKRCRRIKSCELSDIMPGKCGFCVGQNKGIPVNSKGESLYPDDPDYMCDNIVTKPIKCPRPEPDPVDGKPIPALCDPNPVSGQLTNECLIALAKGAGFTDTGAIINVLRGDSGGYYAEKGANRGTFFSALNMLQSVSSIASPNEYFGFGPCSRAEALGYYTTIFKQIINGPTAKARAAAKFLAVGGDYDSCPDDTNATGPFDIACLERVALEAGCQPDGSDFPKEIKQPPNNAPAYCKRFGKPSSDGNIRLYNQDECNSLSGNFHGNGECTKREGGSFSWDCRELNLLGSGVASTKDTYDGMKWGSVMDYFTNLYTQMRSQDKNVMVAATKKCLGIEITPPEPDCGDITGIYCYCYKWDYDNKVVDGSAPKSLFYGRFTQGSMIEFNNNGNYTPFNLGTERLHLRIKTALRSKTTENTNLWVMADDGIGMIANSNIILQKWHDQGPTQYETSKFKLSDTDTTKLQINWYNNSGGYTLVTRIKQGQNFVKIPDQMLMLDQPTGYPFARWDFYEGKIDDGCNTLTSEVVGNIPIGVCDGKKCGFFTDKNYVRITNGIATSGFKTITMMVYFKSNHDSYPRLWEFTNEPLTGNWQNDSIACCFSPNYADGLGFYIKKNSQGPLSWSGGDTVKVGRWYHLVFSIDENLGAYTVYMNGTIVYRSEDPAILSIMKNKTYKDMYIGIGSGAFQRDFGIAWFRMFDYTMTAADVKIDANNGWSTNTLFPKSSGTGW